MGRREQDRAEKIKAQQQRDDWRKVLATPEGLRVFEEVLGYSDVLAGGDNSSYLSGRKSLVIQIATQIRKLAPAGYMALQQREVDRIQAGLNETEKENPDEETD